MLGDMDLRYIVDHSGISWYINPNYIIKSIKDDQSGAYLDIISSHIIFYSNESNVECVCHCDDGEVSMQKDHPNCHG